jgi:uncharacterized protein YecE (DUF72 family)
MNSAEINGSFYSLQRPERYRAWFEETPEDFVFAVKGGRFITHMKRLRAVEIPLANFLASGVLALGHKLGPLLWQLPPNFAFDPERLAEFFELLPRTTEAAADLAGKHDDKLKGDAFTEPGPNRPLRHALEVRHPSFSTPDCAKLLREHDIALVVSDSAGTWVALEDVTAGFVYVRLHGDVELYASGYSDEALERWAGKIRKWARAGRDIYVYFDNDIKVRAPADAISLAGKLSGQSDTVHGRSKSVH